MKRKATEGFLHYAARRAIHRRGREGRAALVGMTNVGWRENRQRRDAEMHLEEKKKEEPKTQVQKRYLGHPTPIGEWRSQED